MTNVTKATRARLAAGRPVGEASALSPQKHHSIGWWPDHRHAVTAYVRTGRHNTCPCELYVGLGGPATGSGPGRAAPPLRATHSRHIGHCEVSNSLTATRPPRGARARPASRGARRDHPRGRRERRHRAVMSEVSKAGPQQGGYRYHDVGLAACSKWCKTAFRNRQIVSKKNKGGHLLVAPRARDGGR